MLNSYWNWSSGDINKSYDVAENVKTILLKKYISIINGYSVLHAFYIFN